MRRVTLVRRDQLSESFRRYRTSRKQVERMRAVILPNTKQNVALTTEGFKAGEASFLQVVTARQTYFEASLAYIEAQIELRKVIVEIDGLQLTGGLNPQKSEPPFSRKLEAELANELCCSVSRRARDVNYCRLRSSDGDCCDSVLTD